MTLGGQLYVDMSGDVDEKGFTGKVDELVAHIQRLTEAQPVEPEPEPEPEPAGSAAAAPVAEDGSSGSSGKVAGDRQMFLGADDMAFFAAGAAEAGDSLSAAEVAALPPQPQLEGVKVQKASSVRELDSAAAQFFNIAGRADAVMSAGEGLTTVHFLCCFSSFFLLFFIIFHHFSSIRSIPAATLACWGFGSRSTMTLTTAPTAAIAATVRDVNLSSLACVPLCLTSLGAFAQLFGRFSLTKRFGRDCLRRW